MPLFDKGGVDELRRVFPSLCGDVCGDERKLWDSIAAEPARLAGVTMVLLSLRRAANRHPLYKEPSEGGDWTYNGPWELPATLEFLRSDNVTIEATEVGKRTSSEARLWIARAEFEKVEAPLVKEGDVIEFWGEPPFGPVRSQTSWDVVKATADGEIWSTEGFVMMRIDVRRKGKYLAIRKTENTK